MSRSRLVLLDANVIIELCRRGLWKALTARHAIALTEAVVDESKYFEAEDGTQHVIDLNDGIASGSVELLEVTTAEMRAFMARFDAGYQERLDEGEAESLAWLVGPGRSIQARICSADGIVWRVLGSLRLRDLGVSLEELISEAGRTARLHHQFSRAFREHYTNRGFREGLQGIGQP